MTINDLLRNQPLRIDATDRRGIRRILLGMMILSSSLFELGAETVTPLVTPSITPAQESPEKKPEPEPVLGFTPLSKDAPTTPPAGAGLGVLPGDPNAEPIVDNQTDPLAPIDPTTLGYDSSADIPLELQDPANDPFSNDPMATNDFAHLPWTPAGGAAGPSISRGLFSGFSSVPGSNLLGGGVLNTLDEGFGFSTALSGTYDSNPSQGYSTPANSGQGDFFTTLGGTVAYRSTASTWTYAANYSGAYNQFLDQTDLSGYNQSAAASLNYESGPMTAGVTLGINYGSGANRNYASVVDEISYIYGLHARYRISAKTSITGHFSQSINDASGGASTGTIDLGASALWAYSPLTEFGPGIRYTHRSGDLQQDRSTIGPTFAVNYKLTTKISLNSIIGMDFVSYENVGSSDTFLFSSIGLNYRASSLWGMSLSLLRDTQASYSTPNEFDETTALRLGYNRNIRRAVWTLGMGFETRASENPNPLAVTRPDRDYLTFDTGLSMPIFSGTTNASMFMRYSDQSGAAIDSWDSFQMGFGINRSF